MTDAQPKTEEQPYFPVSRQKLIVMSVTTLSMYQIYWFYQNYQRVNARAGGGGSPFWRAIAAPITAHGLFARVRTDAQSRFIPVSWSSAGLAVIYFGLDAPLLLRLSVVDARARHPSSRCFPCTRRWMR